MISPRRLILLLGFACLPACLPPRTATPVAKPRSTAAVEITLRHREPEDVWQVEYRISTPTTALVLPRASEFRQRFWRVATPDMVLDAHAGTDRLRSTTGARFSQVTLAVPGYFERPEKDYTDFIRYTDGGTLVYTGHYDAVPIEAAEGASRPATFHFVPRPGEQLVLLGTVTSGPTPWTSVEDGTYVHFGRGTPITSPHMTAVIDAGFPPWLLERSNTLLPRLFALYTRRTAQRLPFKPVVFQSYGEEPQPKSRSFGGGTLPGGVVQLAVSLGASYRQTGDPAIAEKMAYLVAHEAAHLWNGQLFHDDGNDWLHEGGADAFAFLAMRELGVISEPRYWELHADALTKCMVGLSGTRLHAPRRPGESKRSYWCGSTIALLTDALVRRAMPGRDLFWFWARLFAAAGPDHQYSEARYLEQLKDLPGGPALIQILRQLLLGPDPGQTSETLLRQACALVNLALEPGEPPPDSEYDRLVGYQAVGFLVARDCGAAAAIGPAEPGQGYRIVDASGCHQLSAVPRIARIEGLDVASQGARVYDALAARCAAHADVAVSSKDGPRTVVACTEAPSRRLPFLRFVVARPPEIPQAPSPR